MNKLKLLAAASAVMLLTGAGTALGQSAHTSAASTVVTTKSTSLGTILVTGSGQTLYADMGSCTGWLPPDLAAVESQGHAHREGKGEGGRPRQEETGQVTYKGHLLYTFATATTGTSGEGTGGFYVVSPSGSLITKAAKTTGSSGGSSSGGGW